MDTTKTDYRSLIPAENDPVAIRRRAIRGFKDDAARYSIAFGGISVIVSVVLIFFYLAYEVMPLFQSAHVEEMHEIQLQSDTSTSSTLYVGTEEYAEVGAKVNEDGMLRYFDMIDGSDRAIFNLDLDGATATAFATGRIDSDVHAMGLSDGRVTIFKKEYQLTFPDDKRYVTPSVSFPLGEVPIILDENGRSIKKLAIVNTEDDSWLMAALTDDDQVVFSQTTVEESLFGDGEAQTLYGQLPDMSSKPIDIAVSGDRRWIFVADHSGKLSMYDVSEPDDVSLYDSRQATRGEERITRLQILMGGISTLVGFSDGRVEQWFPARDSEGSIYFARIREFDAGDAPVVKILPERQRKGFITVDAKGQMGIHYTTSTRTLYRQDLNEVQFSNMAISPRSNRFLVLNEDGKLRSWGLHNEHPETSLSALWGKVWYESWNDPAYVWQSSAANQDFEPKLSLAPLAFGTFKAAFYAMAVAVPLAILGAIYTAYFMAPVMRQYVKPTVEIMEALPTVILGFLAGLWLAPFLEKHLVGVFIMMFMLPVGVLLFGYAWHKAPGFIRHSIPEEWHASLLVPVVAFFAWLSFALSTPIETMFFDGNMRSFITNDLGITYDQRNSIVIGFAMGFAVIPTIFSVTEDAIFGVPKHLSNGSLALGATKWQTLVKVVMPSASPGIFSAVMLGLGRGVGETMIVLMATGNTPIMEMNIFEGMRTLAANIAVEMPEAEVGSSHFRILFLSGLVLFFFTFVLNTLAEVVRQRLRKKYASL